MSGILITGAPCVRCGSTTRYASCKKCVECQRGRCTQWRGENGNYHRRRQREYIKITPLRGSIFQTHQIYNMLRKLAIADGRW